MTTPAIGRNAPCPCGSGKKFKHCGLGKENNTASGQGVGVMSELLRKELEGRQFNSLEEAQTFLDQITQQKNRRQLDEFHGLSPALSPNWRGSFVNTRAGSSSAAIVAAC